MVGGLQGARRSDVHVRRRRAPEDSVRQHGRRDARTPYKSGDVLGVETQVLGACEADGLSVSLDIMAGVCSVNKTWC